MSELILKWNGEEYGHKSIKSFEDVELNKFNFMFGQNGSGKSHLFESIKSNKSLIYKGERKLTNIILLDKCTFNIHEHFSITDRRGKYERDFWNIVGVGKKNNNYENIINNSTADIYQNRGHTNHTDREKRISAIKNLLDTNDYRRSDALCNKFVDLNVLIDIEEYFAKHTYNMSVAAQIALSVYNRTVNNKDSILKQINKSLKKIEIFKNYKLLAPKLEDINNFSLTIKNVITEEIFSVSDLSSGEKVFMSFVFDLHSNKMDNVDVVLLDETDASINKSMLTNYYKLIRELFVDKGVVVLTISHRDTSFAKGYKSEIFDESDKYNFEISNNECGKMMIRKNPTIPMGIN